MVTPGIIKNLKTDIITQLQQDTVLNQYEFYHSLWEVAPKTKKPCHSIDLGEDRKGEDEASGGTVNNYTIQGFLITYIEPSPNNPRKLTELLDEIQERQKNALQYAQDRMLWSYVWNYKYGRSYKMPWTLQDPQSGNMRLVAHRVITEFEISYEVR
jgi:hypothetical protein